jgi:hypothetical protein
MTTTETLCGNGDVDAGGAVGRNGGMKPLAIDLFCGLNLKIEFLRRADAAIKKLRRAEVGLHEIGSEMSNISCRGASPESDSRIPCIEDRTFADHAHDDRPLAIDLFCGLFGWTEGLILEGWRTIGVDLEDMRGQFGFARLPHTQLVIQDVLTLHGSQFRDAALIVASPPCQAYSYRAMPWKRAKALPPPDNTLFEACFRIQCEASFAAGRHVPLIVENVKGAQKWVGRARWHFGSFYLWGDVPALMPIASASKNGGGSWFNTGSPGQKVLNRNPDGRKQRGSGREWWDKALDERRKEATAIKNEGLKQPGIELSKIGFNVANALEFQHMVEGVNIKRSAEDKRQHIGTSRKFASAMIAKIPLPLSRHIARTFLPH